MDFERSLYSPKPEDVLTEDEYQILQEAQQSRLPCPECKTTLNGWTCSHQMSHIWKDIPPHLSKTFLTVF
jgi:hypothetical protein